MTSASSPAPAHAGEQFASAQLGHAQVGDHEIHSGPGQGLQGLLAVVRSQHTVAPALQGLLVDLQKLGLVVHKQYGAFDHRSCRCVGEIGKNPRGTAPQCILISET